MNQTKLEETLTPLQLKVYDLCCQGKSPEEIAKKLATTLGVVNAQITRIKNRNVPFPGEAGYETRDDKGQVVPPLRPAKAPRSAPSSNEAIQRELENSGQALNAEQFAALSAKVAGSSVKDVHPMVLLGCTIQYVRMTGGRYAAHQLIEDVYGALREFVGDQPPDQGGATAPLYMTDADKIKYLEEQNKLLREEVAKHRGHQGDQLVSD